MGMMLDKKQIWAIFLFGFKIGHKAAETTRNINNTSGSGTTTANKCTMQWWFKKFCKGDKSLEDGKGSGQPSEVDNDQVRAIIEPDRLTTIWEVAEELSVEHSTVIWHLKQTGKVKRLNKWVPCELTENNKIILKCHLLLFYNSESSLNWIVTYDKKWILHSSSSSSNQLRGCS